MSVFKPVIHNLSPEHGAYIYCQAYNAAIGQLQAYKAKRVAAPLAEKLAMLKVLEGACRIARDKMDNALYIN